MAEENEKLAVEQKITAEMKQQVNFTGDANRISNEDAEIRRRLRDSQFGITAELKEQLGIRSKISEQDREVLNLSRQVTSTISESNRELRRQGKLESQILKEKNLRAKTQQQLNDSASLLSKTSFEQLETLIAIARTTGLADEAYTRQLAKINQVDQALANQVALGVVQIGNIETSIQQREKELGTQREVNKNLGIAGALTDNLQRIGLRAFGGLGINLGVFEEGLADAKDQSTALAESFVGIDKIFSELGAKDLMQELENHPNLAPRIVAAAEAYVLSSDRVKDYQKVVNEIMQLEAEREKNQTRLAQLAGKEGLSNEELSEYQKLVDLLDSNVEKVVALKKEQAGISVEAAKAAKETGAFGRRLATLKKLGPGIGQALKQGLVDPFVLGVFSLEGMIRAFGELDSAQTDLQRSTGQGVSQFAQMEFSLVTQVDILKVANALTQELGRNAMNIFPDKILHDVAEFEKMLGLSAKEAGMLGVAAQITGRSMDDIGGSIADTVSSFNGANRSAVNQGQILKDVANASAGVSVSLGKNPEALAKAASQARRLGLELDKLDQIASSLLDFESSIENELSAQLLTGRDINMNKARELALTNDLEGLGKEIFNNSVDIHEFGSMNHIQQEAMAKAIGMSRDELARTAYLRALDNEMTAEQAAAAANVGLEDMKRLDVQKQLEASMQKIAQAMAGPVAAFANILNYVGGIIPALLVVVGLVKAVELSAKAKMIFDVISLARKNKELTTEAILLKLRSKGLGVAISTAIAYAAANPIKALAGLAAAAAVGTALYQIAKPKSIEDGAIDPDGGLMVSGPKGSIQLDPQDSIVAGTNLGGQGQSAQSNRELISKIDELISAVKQGGDVYLDSDKVGTALVKSSYQNS